MSAKPDLAEALQNLPDGATMRDIFDFCQKYNLHNLAQGMIELAPPVKLRQIASEVCMQGHEVHQYRNRFGELEYREALQKLLKRYYHADVPKEAILATSGVSGAIFATMMMLRNENPNAKIGLIVPFYTYHQKQATEAFGREPVYINTNQDFSPNFEEIEKALQSGLQLLLFCNPGNPQANLWKKEDIQKVVKLTEQYNCKLLIDEIYCDLVWKGTFYTPIQDKVYDHVIVARGFSKSLGAQSWRCGYLVTAPELAEKIMRIHDPIYISVPWQQHAIGRYLAEDYEDFVRHIQELGDLMKKNWAVLSKAFQNALGWQPIEPHGSMYGMFYHKVHSDRDAIVAGLECGVGVAPGKIFYQGLPQNTGYVRIHVGISHEKAQQIAKVLEAKTATAHQ